MFSVALPWLVTDYYHYDVRQSYNAATGEASNVTIEDSSEKYWWQRKYMRVNFGSDTAENYARLSYAGFYNATVFEGETGPEDEVPCPRQRNLHGS